MKNNNLYKLLCITMLYFNSSSCQNIPKDAFDVRIFSGTPAFELAKSIQKGDTSAIEKTVLKDSTLLRFQEPIYGETVLTFGVITDRLSSVRKLLELGANPNLRSEVDNSTSFLDGCRYSGIFRDSHEMLRLLIKYGADVNSVQVDTKTKKTISALQLASFHGNRKVVQALVENGADLNSYNKNDSSLVCTALLPGNLEIVKYLLIDQRMPIPDYCVIRQKGEKNERKLTVIDLLNEQDFANDPSKQLLKKEIVDFIKEQK